MEQFQNIAKDIDEVLSDIETASVHAAELVTSMREHSAAIKVQVLQLDTQVSEALLETESQLNELTKKMRQ